MTMIIPFLQKTRHKEAISNFKDRDKIPTQSLWHLGSALNRDSIQPHVWAKGSCSAQLKMTLQNGFPDLVDSKNFNTQHLSNIWLKYWDRQHILNVIAFQWKLREFGTTIYIIDVNLTLTVAKFYSYGGGVVYFCIFDAIPFLENSADRSTIYWVAAFQQFWNLMSFEIYAGDLKDNL